MLHFPSPSTASPITAPLQLTQSQHHSIISFHFPHIKQNRQLGSTTAPPHRTFPPQHSIASPYHDTTSALDAPSRVTAARTALGCHIAKRTAHLGPLWLPRESLSVLGISYHPPSAKQNPTKNTHSFTACSGRHQRLSKLALGDPILALPVQVPYLEAPATAITVT
ncbi:hypothetical protein E2C01_077819 [Portunus trituberculatus]|uniref:Uncharacterized protein n=1 Tax=Portunus trituberculatus TaxID=210409 RepID=A0A5B7INA3_PORTR|nr:hypothetical protein [Portunus trituberculatus]